MSPEGATSDSTLAAGIGAGSGSRRRGLSYSERRWIPGLLVIADVVVLELCLYLGFLARDLASVWFPIALKPPVYAGITAGVLVLPLAYYMMGLYPGYGMSAVERMRHQVTGTAIVFSSLIAWDYLAQDGTWSRGILIVTWVLSTILLPVTFAWLRTLLVRLGQWGTPVVVIGAGNPAERLIRALKRDRKLGLVPIAVLNHGASPAVEGAVVEGVPVLGDVDAAGALARSVRICALAVPDMDGRELAELSARLPFPHVVLLPGLSGLQSAWVFTRDLGGVLGLEVKKNLLLPRNRMVKRALDYVVGVPLFLFMLPLMAVLSLLIMVVSPGTPFYRQQREGIGGRPFGMLKLRTMYADAQRRLEEHLASDPDARREWERYFKLQDDPRILPVIGDFLRVSSLDELPQLWHVLRGEMSLVGPRPFPHYHLDRYDEDFRALRRSVPPGLTGFWQVEERSDADIETQQYLDTYYIRNWSLWLDLYIMFKTIAVVLMGRGAR